MSHPKIIESCQEWLCLIGIEADKCKYNGAEDSSFLPERFSFYLEHVLFEMDAHSANDAVGLVDNVSLY